MKFGAIGYGYIGKFMADIFSETEEFIGFHDPNINGSQPIDNIINKADIIHIASPTPYHLEQAKMVHESGKPCLFKKTFAAKLELLNEMVHFVSPFMTNFDKVIDKLVGKI